MTQKCQAETVHALSVCLSYQGCQAQRGMETVLHLEEDVASPGSGLSQTPREPSLFSNVSPNLPPGTSRPHLPALLIFHTSLCNL